MTAIKFVAEQPEVNLSYFPSLTDEAWREWEITSCVERHNGHRWVLHLEHPDDGAWVSLTCGYCPATGEDLAGDHAVILSVDLPGVIIEFGQHNHPVEAEVPVAVSPVIWSRTWTDCGYEYDAEIPVTATGPIREVSGEPNLSDCPYYQGRGTCSRGCREEPSCITDEPEGGWPSLPGAVTL